MKYRKKPVEIEAFKWSPGDIENQPDWFKARVVDGSIYYQGGDVPYYTIETLEGKMKANQGDYIIQGVKGEIYPCKPDIFEATYDVV